MDKHAPQSITRVRWPRWWLVLVIPPALCIAGVVAWHLNEYPNGRDHCCDKQLNMALIQYAEEHDGKYPTGGAMPEASLSLLYPKYLDGNVLRGKNHSEEVAQALLEAGKPLTPETCGWHYVDGLTRRRTYISQTAIFWDKVGSGHNAERLPHGSHTVNFMDGGSQVIYAEDWPRFLADQQKAAAAIRRGENPERPWVPDRNR